MMRTRELIARSTLFLEAHSPSPRLDSEILLAYVLSVSRKDLIIAGLEVVNEVAQQQFEALLQRRAKHEPIAYIIGKKEFFGLTFKVTPAVLALL